MTMATSIRNFRRSVFIEIAIEIAIAIEFYRLVVVIQPKVCNQFFTTQMSQCIFQF